MQFGERDAIRKMAETRLDEVQNIYRKATLINPEAVRVIFLVKDDPEKYHRFAAMTNDPEITRMAALKRLLDPVTFLKLS